MGKRTLTQRLVAAVAGFVSGGVASLILLGFVVSVFDFNFQSVWQGALVGPIACSFVGFCFPKLRVTLLEFVG